MVGGFLYHAYYSNSDRLSQTYINGVISLAYHYSSGDLIGLKRKTYLDSTTDNPVWQYYNLNRDAFGNLRSITLQKSTDGSAWSSVRTLASYTYSGNNGRLTKMTYGNGAYISYGYDLFDRVIQQTYNNGTTYKYEYNAGGELARQREINASGSTVRSYAFEYDSLGRLIRSRETDGSGNVVQRTEHIYDNANRLTSQSYQIPGTGTHKETYTYDAEDGKLTKQGFRFSTTGVASITLGYDELKRLKTETAVKESATVYTKSYSYRDSTATAGRTTLQVSDVTVKDKNNVTVLSRHYNYNGCGDITSVTDGTNTLASYTYNNLRQLTAETQNYTKYSSSGVGTSATYTAAYTYDTGGNILTASKTMPGSTAVTHTYTYGDSRWADLLTAYDGHSLTYDEIGNPTSYYNGTSYTMTWVQGRRLETIRTGNTTITFAYDMDGIRRSKTVVTDTSTTRTTTETSYITQSGLIIQQTTVKTVLTKSTNTTTTSTRILEFSYDSQQRPFSVFDRYTQASGKYSETRYYYVLNLQGDVVALMTGSGTVWARYTYDAWGKQLQVLNGENKPLGSTSDYFANANPFRYRGYYCDVETGFYYLQSRYYDPNIGRFINADSQFEANLNDGLNMFAYCQNNPVNRVDPTGHSWKSFWDKVGNVIKTAASAVVTAVTSVFGLSYSSTISHTNKPTIKSPSWMPVQFEHGTSSTTTVVQNGTLSKPIVLHAKQDYGTEGLSYWAGAQLSALSASVDLSGSVSRTNTGLYLSTGYKNNTTQVGIRFNLEELKFGIETSTSYKQGDICITEYSNLSINGIGLLAIATGIYTGQIGHKNFVYQPGYTY